MTTVGIPNWNVQGVLPPNDPVAPTSAERSPYSVRLTDFVLHFGTTEKRQTILQGFLDFRTALHAAGLDNGFQWVDGSFLENIETIGNRPPADMDVVTFFYLPQGQTQKSFASTHPDLFNHADTKTRFHVDIKELMGGLDWWKRDGHQTEPAGTNSKAGSCGCN